MPKINIDDNSFCEWIRREAEFYNLEPLLCICGHLNHYHYPSNLKSLRMLKDGCVMCDCRDFNLSLEGVVADIREKNIE